MFLSLVKIWTPKKRENRAQFKSLLLIADNVKISQFISLLTGKDFNWSRALRTNEREAVFYSDHFVSLFHNILNHPLEGKGTGE